MGEQLIHIISKIKTIFITSEYKTKKKPYEYQNNGFQKADSVVNDMTQLLKSIKLAVWQLLAVISIICIAVYIVIRVFST